VTPREIAERLARDAEGIARMLLPDGKREGSEWRVGSIAREPGKSLGVHLNGGKAGVWSDFATGDSGDLLDLWAATRKLCIAGAIREAKAHVGIQDPRFDGPREKTYRRPKLPTCQAAIPGSLGALYLGEERGLPSPTLDAYRIAERGREIVFPSLRNGELIAVKYLGVDRPEGKKIIRVEAGCEPCLFGWQAIPDKARVVTITEGEIDAMSLHAVGIPALSIPFGAGKREKQRWIENEYPHLERFNTVYLCLDADQPAPEATETIAERLGRHRCKVVQLPEGVKDANDLLASGAPREAIRALFDQARTLDPAELKPAPDFLEAVLRQFYPTSQAEIGFLAP
jgi:twinkle protein